MIIASSISCSFLVDIKMCFHFSIVWDLPESSKVSRELHISHTLWGHYTTIIHSSQLMTNIDTVLLNSRIYLDFISFPLTWPRIIWKTHIKSELCLLQAPLAETVTQTSLVLDDFDVSGSTAQRHSRTSFDLTGAKGFGKEDQRDEWHYPVTKGTHCPLGYHGQVHFITWLRYISQVSVWTSIFTFPLFTMWSSEESHYV